MQRFARLLSLLVVLLPGIAAPTALPGGGQQQEYFFRQQADEDVLVRIDGREAAFEATVYTLEGEVILRSTVPGSRLAPVFQYVRATDRDRQLDLRVTAPLDTNRTRFDMGLNRIDVRDDRSARLAQAYEWLSFGLEVPPADTPASWSIKVNALMNAARIFDDFGMEELRLWSRYYVGQLTFHELGDNHAALELAEELLRDPGLRRRPELGLAALRLRLDVLVALRGAGALPAGDNGSDPVQAAAGESAERAASLGQQFERAEALALSGADWAARGRPGDALARFQEALEVAVLIEADDLATRIREALVEIHGRQGDVAASSAVLQAIESQLTEDGANDELAQNLLAQGLILNRTYRFEAARDVLRQALAFEHNSATRDQVRLALAEAAWSLGDLEETLVQARAAVLDGEGRYRRPTPLLEVARGIGLIAGVHRARARWSAMRTARQAQGQRLESLAERLAWDLERAEDALAVNDRAAAISLLREVRNRSSRGDPRAHLATLWLCRLGSDCAPGAATSSFEALQASAVPRHSVQAGLLLGETLRREGRTAEALERLEATIREMTFYRYALPGVLADRYWRDLDDLAQSYLDALRVSGSADRLLLGLARVRWLRASEQPTGLPFDRDAVGLDTDGFRAELARRATSRDDADGASKARALRARLTEGQSAFEATTDFLSPRGLADWLATLAPGEAVLDYHGSEGRLWALLGTRGGVARIPLGQAPDPKTVTELLADPGSLSRDRLAGLGERWFGPLRDRLPGRVYLAAGDVSGLLPFEALPIDGRPAHEILEFVRLAAFPARPAPGQRLRAMAPERVFLAGRPTDYQSGYLRRLEAGAELAAVMDRFVGPGLQVIQGSALLPDEFATEAFRAADLVHLSAPVRLDLARPGASRLELSEERRGEGRLSLGPADLASWRLSADLLVLSQAEVRNPGSSRIGRPPLISEALAAGVGVVLVTVRPGDDAETGKFLSAFYAALEVGEPPAEALVAAREVVGGGAPAPWPAHWRYQLWVE